MIIRKNNWKKLGASLLSGKTLSVAIKLTILMLVLTGVAYPLILIGIGQSTLPFQSTGSLTTMDGKKEVIGSILIGQEFASPKFLHIRPPAQSASGVDPHITPEDAFAQAVNVSKATEIPLNAILTLVELNLERNKIDNLIVFAPHYVNVLEVNKELVRQYPEIYAEYTNDRSDDGTTAIGTSNQSGDN